MNLHNKIFTPFTHLFYIYFLSFFFILLCCKSENRHSNDINIRVTTAQQTKKKEFKINNYELLFKKIVYLQNLVSNQPANQTLMEKLLFEAFYTEEKLYYCVGMAVANPKLPISVQQQTMKRTAQITASRWVLYFSAWQRGNFVSLNSSIIGELPTTSSPLFEKLSGDTLFVLFSVSLKNN